MAAPVNTLYPQLSPTMQKLQHETPAAKRASLGAIVNDNTAQLNATIAALNAVVAALVAANIAGISVAAMGSTATVVPADQRANATAL